MLTGYTERPAAEVQLRRSRRKIHRLGLSRVARYYGRHKHPLGSRCQKTATILFPKHLHGLCIYIKLCHHFLLYWTKWCVIQNVSNLARFIMTDINAQMPASVRVPTCGWNGCKFTFRLPDECGKTPATNVYSNVSIAHHKLHLYVDNACERDLGTVLKVGYPVWRKTSFYLREVNLKGHSTGSAEIRSERCLGIFSASLESFHLKIVA